MKRILPLSELSGWKAKELLIFASFLVCALSYGQDQCAPVGWATQNGGTTGGGNATPVTVTTLSELQAQASSDGPKVIYVSGTMGSGESTRISVASDKTIFGLPGATIYGGIDVKDVSNVIIRNLKVRGPGAVDVDGVDGILVQNATNIWLDHLEVYDGQDGNMDIVNGSNYVSVTWCKFHYTSASQNHMFCNLIGNSDSKTSDRGKLKVTMQYNWYTTGVQERMPRVRFGQVHVVNNLYDSPDANNCVRAGVEADLLVESNVFINVEDPIDLYENDFTAVTARNNIFSGTTGNTSGSGTSFTPPYSLTITPAGQVETLVKAGAGATLTGPDCDGGTGNQSPIVSITAPSDNSTYTAPASITLEATASDPDGSVTTVEFYNGNTFLGSDNSSGYSFSWNNVQAGTYIVTARAIDNEGAETTSSSITIVVNGPANQSPLVSITAPANNAEYTAPASITLEASASDPDGSVSLVEFFYGTTLLGSDNSAGYSFAWNNVQPGVYSITARATDNQGAVATSQAITVIVNYSGDVSVLQAEDACSFDGLIETEHSGHNGSGYLNTTNARDAQATWSVYSSSSQAYSLNFRYSNGGTTTRPVRVLVNGAEQVASLGFPVTSDWTTWATISVDLQLVQGNNSVQFVALTSDGAPNMDEITVYSSDILQGSCVVTGINDVFAHSAECFPNPFNDLLQIKAKGAFSYSISDMKGTPVEEGAGHDRLSTGEDLMPGLYLLRIKNAEGTRIIKICKN